jgi:hypothetical protein
MIFGKPQISLHHFTTAFPEIQSSSRRIFLHQETPTIGNWRRMAIDNVENFSQYDKVIIDTGTEAPHFFVLDDLNKLLRDKGINDVLYINSGLDFDRRINLIFLPSFFRVENPPTYIPPSNRSRLYSSLSRIANGRFSRIFFTYKLYEYDLLNDGIVTCGCCEEDGVIENWISMFPAEFRSKMPMCYDGPVSREISSQFVMTIGNDCLINVVNESSFDIRESDIYRGIMYNDGHYWARPFFTEKTAKAINSRQMMLFACVKGYVERLRCLGFDVFDDVIDHSYDDVNSPDERLDMVARELKRLSQEGLERLKKVNMLVERLEHNVQVMSSVHTVNMSRYSLKIKSWALDEK